MADSLVAKSIGILVAAIVIGSVAIPSVTTSLVTETEAVANETQASGGSTPDVFTVDNVFEGLVQDSETVFLNDSLDNTEYKLADSDYEIDYEAGEFNVTTADLDSDGNNEINSTNDEYKVSYDYKPDGYLEGQTNTIAGFVPLGLALSLFVASISLVMT